MFNQYYLCITLPDPMWSQDHNSIECTSFKWFNPNLVICSLFCAHKVVSPPLVLLAYYD